MVLDALINGGHWYMFKGLFHCIFSDHHSPFLQSIFLLILAFVSSFIFYFR